MFSNSDSSPLAVTAPESDKLIQLVQPLNYIKAMEFQLVGCLAWNASTEDQRPRCVSLMDPSRIGWYVHHRDHQLLLDAENDADGDQSLFALNSFFLRTDWLYPGHYAFESVNFPDWYIWLGDDGYLRIEPDAYTDAYYDAASFKLYPIAMSRECRCLFF